MYVTFTCLNFRFFLLLFGAVINDDTRHAHAGPPKPACLLSWTYLSVPLKYISRPGPCSGGKDGSPDKVGSNVRDETDADDGTKRALRRESDARASGSSKRVRVYPHMHAAQPSSPSSSPPRPPLLRPPRRVPVPPLPPGYHPQLPLMAGEGKAGPRAACLSTPPLHMPVLPLVQRLSIHSCAMLCMVG